MTTPVDQESFAGLVARLNTLLDQQQATGGGSGGGFPAIGALPIAADADLDATMRLVGTAKTGAATKISLGQIIMRTPDLREQMSLIGNEMLLMLTNDGKPCRIATGALTRKFTGGVIDVSNAPYGVVADGKRLKGMTMLTGSTTLECDVAVFHPSDVGKMIRMSDVGNPSGYGGGLGLTTTIVAYQDARHVTLGAPAQFDKYGGEAAWGTDNTAGMRQALADAVAPSLYDFGGVVLMPPGGIITRALTIGQGVALVGRGRQQTVLMHWRDGNSYDPLLTNVGQYVYDGAGKAFAPGAQFLQDFGMDGLRYQVPDNSHGTACYRHAIPTNGGIGSTAYTGDPGHYYVNISVTNASANGFELLGRHSGTIIGLDVSSCFAAGFQNQSFDVNILNVLAIANGGPGYLSGEFYQALNQDISPNGGQDFQIEAAAGCNIQNLKVSFNGTGSYGDPMGGGIITAANLVECGNSNLYTALRVQESCGSNIVIWGSARYGATKNKFVGAACDDTADQAYPALAGISGDARAGIALPWRASITIAGAGCQRNYFFDATAASAVRSRDYASHSVYYTRDAQDNYVRMFQIDTRTVGGGTDGSERYFNPDFPDAPYGRGPVGTNSPSGSPASLGNTTTVNGQTY